MVGFRSSLTVVLSVLLVVGAMVVVAAPPAAAQTAKNLKCSGCVKSRQLKNNGIKGKDMKPTISLGTSSDAGSFSVKDTSGSPSVSLDGALGHVTNSLSGDGLVKAWARITDGGTVASCYRCNTNGAETRKTATGRYEVDFTPLATDISGRPRSCTSEDAAGNNADDNSCSMTGTPGDASSVNISIIDIPQGAQNGDPEDGEFTILIF